MNIHHFFPKQEEPFENSAHNWTEIFNRREHTFRGFAEIEKDKGFIQPAVSTNTAAGQEMLRILGFRVIEEAAESLDARTWPHRKEEIIDSFNYLISMVTIDDNLQTFDAYTSMLRGITAQLFSPHHKQTPLTLTGLGNISHQIAGRLADTFRNRAWMNHAQDIYFAGGSVMRLTVGGVTRTLLQVFTDFDEFYRYYVAKDDVLQFFGKPRVVHDVKRVDSVPLEAVLHGGDAPSGGLR